MRTGHDGHVCNCIVAGVEHPDAAVGLYACDENAYRQFAKLFDPVVKELHGYDAKSGALAKHNFDLSAIEWSKVERTKHCLKFVQVVASRNLKGYSFVPNLDPIAKAEIESILNRRINTEIDVKMEIGKILESDRKRIADEGLLFTRHPSIESIVPTAKCNEKCFIYYSNDLSQVVWVNAEDHVQYFITQRQNPDLRQACEKLFKRLNGLELDVPLCQDQNLGYLTCSPEHLGTTLRVRVVVQLQKAAEKTVKLELLSNFCAQYAIEVRRVAENTFEFVQRKTLQLGKTEADIVEGLVLCVSEVLRFESDAILIEEEQNKKHLAEVSARTLKNMPQFDEMNTSLIRPFINADVWMKYGELATSFNHTLRDCINPGLVNHKIGIIALDADCYEKFADLFTNVILMYHEGYKAVNFPLYDVDEGQIAGLLRKCSAVEFIEDGYLMWQGNLKSMSFPAGLNRKLREECNSKVLLHLSPFTSQYSMKVGGIEEVEEIKSSLYFGDLIAEKNKIQELSVDWPQQRSVLSSPKTKFIFMTNVMDHLTIAMPLNSKDFMGNLTEFFSTLDKLVTEQTPLWAFSETFGFHTTLPTDIGNAFTFKLAVKLPGVEEITTYLPLAESKGVLLSKMEDAVLLSHKHKFKSAQECIVKTLELLNEIIEAEKVEFKEEVKSLGEFFGEELVEKCRGIVTSSGIGVESIRSRAGLDPNNPVLVEGVESFNALHELYSNALKIFSNGSFNLDTFNFNQTDSLLAPLELPALPPKVTGKTIEVSRNIDRIPFPAFMSAEDRANVSKQLTEIFNTFDVVFLTAVGEERWRLLLDG